MTSLPEYIDGKVRAPCRGCGGKIGTFVPVMVKEIWNGGQNWSPGATIPIEVGNLDPAVRRGVSYRLLQCSMCQEVALARVVLRVENGSGIPTLDVFYPTLIVPAKLPAGLPEGVAEEFHEAERCAAGQAYRGGGMVLRSAVEKLFRANGYSKKKVGDLIDCIKAAAADRVLGAGDAQRAQVNVRVFGNRLLHDPWSQLTEAEWEETYGYARRLIEAFYEHRPSTLKILMDSGRMLAEGQPADAGQSDG